MCFTAVFLCRQDEQYMWELIYVSEKNLGKAHRAVIDV